jgi:hypothetical protein
MQELTVKEFTKAKATDVEFGIFRARIVQDFVDDYITVEFGSRGGWDEEGGTMILAARGEFTDLLSVLQKAHDLLNSIPDEDDEDQDEDDLDLEVDEEDEELNEDLYDDEDDE